jgi:hypothetical protein
MASSAGSCPASPPSFKGSSGGSLTAYVNIQNSATLNGFDILVKTDDTILHPQGINIFGLGGTIQAGGSIIVVCINGTKTLGTASSCSPQDGPGAVHVAVTGSTIKSGSATGSLFSISYQIKGNTFGTPVGFQTGCSPSSVAGTSICINITDHHRTDPENAQAASFANPLPGLVCMANSSTTCPMSPPAFTGPVGSQVTVDVNVQASNSLNGFDIRIQADPNILNGFSISIAGSLLQNSAVLVQECINGFFMGGSCQSSPGIVEVIIAASMSTTAPTTGRLFSVTYNVVGTTAGISIAYPTGCSSSSVSGTTTCVSVSDAGAVVPETIQAATFSN